MRRGVDEEEESEEETEEEEEKGGGEEEGGRTLLAVRAFKGLLMGFKLVMVVESAGQRGEIFKGGGGHVRGGGRRGSWGIASCRGSTRRGRQHSHNSLIKFLVFLPAEDVEGRQALAWSWGSDWPELGCLLGLISSSLHKTSKMGK